MSASGLLLLGEGERDVGRIDPTTKRRPPCDFEGDLPRLVRRLSEVACGRTRFGYDADTIHAVNTRIAHRGRPTRLGGKSKALRNAVIAALQTHSTVIALIDARVEELQDLQRDVHDILTQCRERSAEAKVAIGLAIQEVEIWMMADPHSRDAALGANVGQEPVPDDLEAVGDPKALWRGKAGQVHVPDGADAELHADQLRRAAWASLRPDVVAHSCPRGFAPFMREVLDALPWTDVTG